MPALTVPADSPADAARRLSDAHAVPHCSRRIGAARRSRRARCASTAGGRARGDCRRRRRRRGADDALLAPADAAARIRGSMCRSSTRTRRDRRLDKPAGMPSHALRADETDTIANFLLARYPEVARVGKTAARAGHRASSRHRHLRRACWWRARRRPTLRCAGSSPRSRCTRSIAPSCTATSAHRGRAAHADRARPPQPAQDARLPADATAGGAAGGDALSAARTLRRAARCSRCEIRTGVMHQIRVHLASIGHPVVGDRLYGAAGVRGAPRASPAARLPARLRAPGRAVSRMRGQQPVARGPRGVLTTACDGDALTVDLVARAGAERHAAVRHAACLRGGLLALALGLRAGGAQVVDVVRIFDQPLVHVVADLLALGADEVDAFDGLVDALAVEDAALQLLDADAEQVFVLALDLAAAGFVFGEIALLVGLRCRRRPRRSAVPSWPCPSSVFGPYAPPAASARAFDVAAVLVAHPEEPLATEPGEHGHAALRAAARDRNASCAAPAFSAVLAFFSAMMSFLLWRLRSLLFNSDCAAESRGPTAQKKNRPSDEYADRIISHAISL